jgi:hypothetical protein
MPDVPAKQKLAALIARYTPEVAARAHATLKKMRALLPGAVELIYDNYNATVIGFGPSERASEAYFSVVLYPRWVTLFFLEGALLPDPKHLLKGNGKIVRHVVLEDDTTLDSPGVRALMARAIALADVPIDPQQKPRMVVRAIAAKQRPRRPPGAPAAPAPTVRRKRGKA